MLKQKQTNKQTKTQQKTDQEVLGTSVNLCKC